MPKATAKKSSSRKKATASIEEPSDLASVEADQVSPAPRKRTTRKKEAKQEPAETAVPDTEEVASDSGDQPASIDAQPDRAEEGNPSADNGAEPSQELAQNDEEGNSVSRKGRGKDKTARTIHISQLQAMSMVELNGMAKELEIENFGTIRNMN